MEELSISHFADYIKRVLVAPHQLNGSDVLERYGSQSADAGVSSPVFHSIRAISGAVRRVRPGDTIWWFSQLQGFGKRLPPSLDARIEVAEVSDTGDGRMRFEAVTGNYPASLPMLEGCAKVIAVDYRQRVASTVAGSVPRGDWPDADRPAAAHRPDNRRDRSGAGGRSRSDSA